MLGSMLGRKHRGAAGFTLVEMLIALAILAVIATALGVISVTTIGRYNDDSRERVLNATTARTISRLFAKDVQGASGGVAPGTCGGTASLVTLTRSSDGTKVGWLLNGDQLLRDTNCDDGTAGTPVVRGLDGTPPASVTPGTGTAFALTVRRGTYEATMDGRSRIQASTPGTTATTIPSGLDTPQFLSLAGTTPLRMNGSAKLHVIGNAYINKGTNGVAVDIDGNQKKLYVSGKFGIQSGSACNSCSASTVDGYAAGTKPFQYPGVIPDPYGFLPAPAPGPKQTTCPKSGGVRTCQPGVYESAFPPDGQDTYQLQPGIYTLRSGINMTSTNYSLSGTGVLIYNEVGDVKIKGGKLDLHPSTTGFYAGVLLFQARTNKDAISISGNSSLSSLGGIIYAPVSTDVELAGGGGQLRVGAVVGQSLTISGTGDVYINGA